MVGVLLVTISYGAVSIGVMHYHCMFGSINEIMVVCPQTSSLRRTYVSFTVTCAVDVVSDFFSKKTSRSHVGDKS